MEEKMDVNINFDATNPLYSSPSSDPVAIQQNAEQSEMGMQADGSIRRDNPYNSINMSEDEIEHVLLQIAKGNI